MWGLFQEDSLMRGTISRGFPYVGTISRGFPYAGTISRGFPYAGDYFKRISLCVN